MTVHEVRCTRALERVSFGYAPAARFARQMSRRAAIAAIGPQSQHAQLTRAQSLWLSALVWRYRSQITDRYLVVACGIRTRCGQNAPISTPAPAPEERTDA